MQSKEQILPNSGSKLIPNDLPSRRLFIGPNINGSTKNDIFLFFANLIKVARQRTTDNGLFVSLHKRFDYDLRTDTCRHKK